eukprot:m.41799 g.41799  ORF g.41799 m.41799 type:complete len:438 (+) comp10555_c0_seq1:372-1685(+)
MASEKEQQAQRLQKDVEYFLEEKFVQPLLAAIRDRKELLQAEIVEHLLQEDDLAGSCKRLEQLHLNEKPSFFPSLTPLIASIAAAGSLHEYRDLIFKEGSASAPAAKPRPLFNLSTLSAPKLVVGSGPGCNRIQYASGVCPGPTAHSVIVCDHDGSRVVEMVRDGETGACQSTVRTIISLVPHATSSSESPPQPLAVTMMSFTGESDCVVLTHAPEAVFRCTLDGCVVWWKDRASLLEAHRSQLAEDRSLSLDGITDEEIDFSPRDVAALPDGKIALTSNLGLLFLDAATSAISSPSLAHRINSLLSEPRGLAVDDLSGLLFITDQHRVCVFTIAGDHIHTLTDFLLSTPTSVTVMTQRTGEQEYACSVLVCDQDTSQVFCFDIIVSVSVGASSVRDSSSRPRCFTLDPDLKSLAFLRDHSLVTVSDGVVLFRKYLK